MPIYEQNLSKRSLSLDRVFKACKQVPFTKAYIYIYIYIYSTYTLYSLLSLKVKQERHG